MTLRLNGSTSGYVEIDAPAVAGTSVLTLPTGTGTIATTTDQGLVLVSPTSIANSGGSASASGGAVTFTGVSSVSLNGVFTSTYENYQAVFTVTLAGGADVNMRWRTSGTDASGSNYVNQWARAINTTFTGSLTTTTFASLTISGGSFSIYNAIISKPNQAEPTQTLVNVGGGDTGIAMITSRHTLSTAYDGLTLSTSSGSFSGSIRVYGYKNS